MKNFYFTVNKIPFCHFFRFNLKIQNIQMEISLITIMEIILTLNLIMAVWNIIRLSLDYKCRIQVDLNMFSI